ncbi:hypothetical protein BKA61DRAFT_578398 [Leptodontidium sp. MPI-SDFR-AT-0119]|nr:hypothetical protein BKA61DRAFT_578398 [Leptodontidium sp. MPI-SDFR-AT-0119]
MELQSWWFRDPGDPKSATVSLELGEKASHSSKLLGDDESVSICFEPYHPTVDKKTGEKSRDVTSLAAIMCEENDAVVHIGDHLARITLDSELDVPFITSWSSGAPSKQIYLKVTDTTKPTKSSHGQHACGVYSSSSSVVNIIAVRTLRTIGESSFVSQDDKLCIRIWSDQVESKILQGVDRSNFASYIADYKSKTRLKADALGDIQVSAEGDEKVRQHVDFDFSASAAASVCKVLGLLETTNFKSLKLRNENRHPELLAIMSNPVDDRYDEQWTAIPALIMTVISDPMGIADMVFCTTTIAASKEATISRKRSKLSAAFQLPEPPPLLWPSIPRVLSAYI